MLGALIAFVAALGFAFGNIFIRKGVRSGDDDNGVLASLVVNVAVMTPALLVLAFTGNVPSVAAAGVAWFVVAGLSSSFLGRSFLFAAIRHTGASRAGSIAQLQPVFAIAVSIAFLGEGLSPREIIGTIVALGGLALFSVPALRARRHEPFPAADLNAPPSRSRPLTDGQYDGALAGRSLFGIVLAVLAAAAFGVGYVLANKGLDVVPNALVGATVGSWSALVAHTIAARLRAASSASSKPNFRRAFLLGGVAVTVGQLSVFLALSRTTVSTVAVTLSLQGVLTVLLGAWLLRATEALTVRVAVAAVVIASGAALLASAG